MGKDHFSTSVYPVPHALPLPASLHHPSHTHCTISLVFCPAVTPQFSSLPMHPPLPPQHPPPALHVQIILIFSASTQKGLQLHTSLPPHCWTFRLDTSLLPYISVSCDHICIEHPLVCLSVPMFLLHTVEQISPQLHCNTLPLVRSHMLRFTNKLAVSCHLLHAAVTLAHTALSTPASQSSTSPK